MTEPTESIEFSEQDVADLQQLGITDGDVPTYHPILEVWREVLKPARAEASAKVTPTWANRIVTSYTGITYADMENYRNTYFQMLLKLADILDETIASDEECLNYETPEEDVEHNSTHYRTLLTEWQVQLLRWEMDWECTAEDAAVKIAALSEIHKTVFGPTGITAFLDNIKFQFTEADQAELGAALEAVKEGQ